MCARAKSNRDAALNVHTDRAAETGTPMKLNKFVFALLIVAIIGVTALCVYQNHVIQVQRQEIQTMLRFIFAGCPFDLLH